MKRLIKKSKHGIENRDEALTYIDGEIYTGPNHPRMIDEFLKENKKQGRKIIEDFIGNFGLDDEEAQILLDKFEDLGRVPSNVLSAYNEFERSSDYYQELGDVPLGFGHIVEDDNAIYIEKDSIQNVDFNTIINEIKNNYPDYNVYDDSSYSNYGGTPEDYTKVASKQLIKQAAYVYCRNCNWSQDDFWSESYNPLRYLLN
jgi:hypothetical protein